MSDGGAAVIQGLLLDFSGVIIDSESADEQAWREEFERAGVPLTAGDYTHLWVHWSWHRVLAPMGFLRAWNPETDIAVAMDRRLARYTQLCANLPARPGVTDWLRQARQQGMRVGLASNDSTGRAPAHLSRLGLIELFDAVVTLPEGMARKPAPDLYHLALRTLGLDAADTVVVEDSSHGISAAHRAGIRAIAFPTPLSQRTDLRDADLITDPHAHNLTEVLHRLPATAGPRPAAAAAMAWRHARTTAAGIVGPALPFLPRKPALITGAVDLLAALCYQHALTTGGDAGMAPPVPLGELLNLPTVHLDGALAGLDHLIPSLRRWHSDPQPDRRVLRPPAEVLAVARSAVDHLHRGTYQHLTKRPAPRHDPQPPPGIRDARPPPPG